MSEVIKKAATNEVVEFLYGDLRERSAPVIFNSATGNPVVFNDGANGLPIKSLKVNFSPIQNGSGDPSPSNVRSIVPWEGLSVFGRGKNLFDEDEYQHIYTDPDYVWDPVPYRCKYIQLSPNTTYTISSQTETTSDEIVLINNKQQPNIMPFFDLRNTSQTMTLKTDGTGRLYIGSVNGDDASTYNRIKECKIQIEVGSSATSYEPYHSIVDTDIIFPSPVYGGTLDVVSGVLTITHVLWTNNTADMNNESDYPGWKNAGIKNLIGAEKGGAIYTNVNVGNVFAVNTRNANDIVYLPKSEYVLIQDEWKALAIDIQIAVPLNEPQQVQLTSAQIQTILGVNIVWSDANGDIEVEYRADTEKFVEKSIANLPIATKTKLGVIKVPGNTGLYIVESSGVIATDKASLTGIKAGTSAYNPIVPELQHASAFYALAKLAGEDMAQSSNAVGTYTDPAKTAIQKMFGFDGILGDYELSTTASKAYAIGETFIFNGNRYRATTAIAINDVLAPGTNCELDPLDGKYVRDTDIARSDMPGIVMIGAGLNCNASTGLLTVAKATDGNIKSGANTYSPIVPKNQHQSAFYGLAKAAGDTTQSQSDNAVGTYTAEAKAAIQTMLGIEADIPLVETVTGATVSITGMPNVRYICETAISELTITPPASGSIVVRFTAGSNCIVSLPQTVKLPAWFDISSLEDGTTYEIIITDGVYGGVMSWA